jgi:hypothetical protein
MLKWLVRTREPILLLTDLVSGEMATAPSLPSSSTMKKAFHPRPS